MYGVEKVDVGVPLIVDRDGVDTLSKSEIYVIEEVFNINGKRYVKLHGHENKYGISLFRNLEPEEEVKLRKLKIKTILSNG